MNPVVLSSETPEATAAFYAQRLGLDPPEPAAAAAVESANESAPAKAPEAEGASSEQQEQTPNPEDDAAITRGASPKVRGRFSELTEQRKAAEAKALAAEEAAAKVAADLEAERKARVLAEQAAAELRAKHEPPKADPLGAKPTRDQFVNDDEFALALEDYTTEKVKFEFEAKTRAEKAQARWNEREKAAKAAIPDYDAAMESGKDLRLPNPVLNAIASSDQGPWIAHHLATHPEEVAKIAAMDPDDRLRYVGKLEGKFEAASSAPAAPAADDKSAKPAPAAAAQAISRAPAPITPLKGGNAIPESPLDSKGNFPGTFAEWKAARKAGKI